MATLLSLAVLLWISMLTCLKYCSCQNYVNLYQPIYSRHRGGKQGGVYTRSKSELLFTTTDFAEKYGYPVETHTVTTEDGYLLTVHRIPGSPKASSTGVKTPVLIMHGIFAASDSFVLTGPKRAWAFLLADAGYDVWMNNARGNFYSRKHKTLSPRDPKFWNFSFHEMGVYDLPAVIDYILEATNHTQLFYIGHSMGTSAFFVLSSMKPEYNQKIHLMVALAPATYLSVDTRPTYIMLLLSRTAEIYRGLQRVGIQEVFPRHDVISGLIGNVCRDGQPTLGVCLIPYFGAFGTNPHELNTTMVPLIFSHLLAGTSLKTLAHYAENIYSARFQKFDGNVTMGSKMTEYDLYKVTAPVSLYYAMNDGVVDPKGVLRLSQSLPNVVNMKRLPGEKTNHVDFIFSNSVKNLVIDDVMKLMKKY